MFGAFGGAVGRTSLTFVSNRALREGKVTDLGLAKRLVAVKGCRNLSKKDMVLNDALPVIEVDPETYQVRADGVHLTCKPAQTLPLSQLYSLF